MGTVIKQEGYKYDTPEYDKIQKRNLKIDENRELVHGLACHFPRLRILPSEARISKTRPNEQGSAPKTDRYKRSPE